MQVFVDHHDWRVIACPQADDRQQRKAVVGRGFTQTDPCSCEHERSQMRSAPIIQQLTLSQTMMTWRPTGWRKIRL